VRWLRRAALAHDLGRVGVSNAIWEKPAPLGFGEWERARLHPHFTERAFAQSATLAPVGALAGAHHERLDGSGYHRGARGPALDRATRILAVADCYGAMREVRERPRELPAGLTDRELEVLLVLARGKSNQVIGEDLGISAKTVGHHVERVYRKTGVRSRAAATLWAFEHDLVRVGRA
jgi:DNA-binding CsgD family transcriptional regulator